MPVKDIYFLKNYFFHHITQLCKETSTITNSNNECKYCDGCLRLCLESEIIEQER
jgi:hypothetical protein